MKKYLLSVTTAALLFSPFVFADNTMGQDQQMMTPSTTDSMPSTPTTTTTVTTTPSTTTDIQLKTTDGKVIHVQIDPQDLQGMSVGDKLEITDLGTSATASQGASTGASSTTTTQGTTTTTGGTEVTQ
jgi:hypothetical protein